MNRFYTTLGLLFAGVLLCSAQTQIIKVYEYKPAPGQFVNTLPEYEEGDTEEDMCRKCEISLEGDELIHLGAFGGYITLGFDHPVQNLKGSDLRICGNAFYAAADPVYGNKTIGGSMEPGIVLVGVGATPETAEWFELAGSEYNKTEKHDFSITYYKPTAESGEHSQFSSTYDNYIRWSCNWTSNGERIDSTGYHMKNSFHRQTYWPQWETADSIRRDFGCLPNNAVEQSGKGTYWVLYRYAQDAYGYADCSLNTDDYSTFDIDWAVDKQGNPANLSEINFIKIYTGIFQYCGWLGETSTEISSVTDLHLLEGYDDNPIIIGKTSTGVSLPSIYKSDNKIYNLQGQRVYYPIKGNIYIRNGKKFIAH